MKKKSKQEFSQWIIVFGWKLTEADTNNGICQEDILGFGMVSLTARDETKNSSKHKKMRRFLYTFEFLRAIIFDSVWHFIVRYHNFQILNEEMETA